MDSERRNRPGDALPDWQLYEPRVDQETGKTIGVKTPEGKFYRFHLGENGLSLDRATGETDRRPFIIKSDGTKVPFEDWASEQESLDSA